MLQYYSYKYRIYPSKDQSILLEKHFGANRFIWNYFLNERKEYYLKNKEEIEAKRIKGGLNYLDNCKALTELKEKEEFKWLKEINSQSLQYTLKTLDSAYSSFFRKTHKFPNFKNKHGKQSFTNPQWFKLEGNKIFIRKFTEGIKVKLDKRAFEGKFIKATISKNCSNQYFISITVEKELIAKIKNENQIGIDLGIKEFVVVSNGERFENPKYLKKYEIKLKYNQRQLFKKKKGSKNRIKAKLKVAKIHNKISNCRNDFQHKISSKLISENQTICLEDLAVKNMVKNHKLAKSISDASWSSFVNKLQYKAFSNERNIIKIDRFFPSSKTCNNCNYINSELQLKDREWKCPSCDYILDRDLNAAKNILKQGLNLKAAG